MEHIIKNGWESKTNLNSTRKKYFFSSNGKPRILENSAGVRRSPGTKDLQTLLGCDDPLFLSFLSDCLKYNPKERITPAQALQHPWILENNKYNGSQELEEPYIQQASLVTSRSNSSKEEEDRNSEMNADDIAQYYYEDKYSTQSEDIRDYEAKSPMYDNERLDELNGGITTPREGIQFSDIYEDNALEETRYNNESPMGIT